MSVAGADIGNEITAKKFGEKMQVNKYLGIVQHWQAESKFFSLQKQVKLKVDISVYVDN